MFYTYILWSESRGRFYIGHTQDVTSRVDYHNRGNVKSTRPGVPWVLVHAKGFSVRYTAVLREREIKGWKSAEAVRRLITETPAEGRH